MRHDRGETIRAVETRDHAGIDSVLRAAFEGPDEAELVQRLRDEGYARIELVAEVDGQVVGHLLFSEIQIASPAGDTAVLSLAPLSVTPARQRSGIGTRLMHAGLERCRASDFPAVIVLGHADYYPRFGFSAALAEAFDAPFSGPSFMALELIPGALASLEGEVVYSPPFGIA